MQRLLPPISSFAATPSPRAGRTTNSRVSSAPGEPAGGAAGRMSTRSSQPATAPPGTASWSTPPRPGVRRPAVVSHQSAAVLQGLPLWDVALDRVHVTRLPRAWSDSSAVRVLPRRAAQGRRGDGGRRLSRSPLPSGPPWTWPGPCDQQAAVVALDAALHTGAMSHDALRGRMFDIAGTPGSRSAARAVTAADGRSMSVGE